MISLYEQNGIDSILLFINDNYESNASWQEEFVNLLDYLIQSHKLDECLKLASVFLSFFPFHPEVTLTAAASLQSKGMKQQAWEVLKGLEGHYSPESFQDNSSGHVLPSHIIEKFNGLYSQLIEGFDQSIELYWEWCRALPQSFSRLARAANFFSQHIYGEADQNTRVIALLPRILEQLIVIAPQAKSQAMGMLADLCISTRDYPAAINFLSEAIRLGNTSSENIEKLSYLYLSDQQWSRGTYEILNRTIRSDAPFAEKYMNLPRVENWAELKRNASPMVILLEQGIGDQLLHLPLLKEILSDVPKGSKVICVEKCVSIVERLLQLDSEDGIEVSSACHDPDNFSARLWMGDILSWFNEFPVESFKNRCPLIANKNSDYYEAYKQEVIANNGVDGDKPFRLGISWCGPGRKGFDRKDIALVHWLPLFKKFPEVELVSVQYGDVSEEIKQFCLIHNISIKVEPVDQFNDLETAVDQLSTLDALLTTSSTVAHLAGAMGISTAVMLPYVPLWYWEYQFDHQSCFYPSVHLINRTTPNDFSMSIEGASGWLGSKLAS